MMLILSVMIFYIVCLVISRREKHIFMYKNNVVFENIDALTWKLDGDGSGGDDDDDDDDDDEKTYWVFWRIE